MLSYWLSFKYQPKGATILRNSHIQYKWPACSPVFSFTLQVGKHASPLHHPKPGFGKKLTVPAQASSRQSKTPSEACDHSSRFGNNSNPAQCCNNPQHSANRNQKTGNKSHLLFQLSSNSQNGQMADPTQVSVSPCGSLHDAKARTAEAGDWCLVLFRDKGTR